MLPSISTWVYNAVQALLVLLLAGWIDYSMPYWVLMSCLRYNSAIVRLMGVVESRLFHTR